MLALALLALLLTLALLTLLALALLTLLALALLALLTLLSELLVHLVLGGLQPAHEIAAAVEARLRPWPCWADRPRPPRRSRAGAESRGSIQSRSRSRFDTSGVVINCFE